MANAYIQYGPNADDPPAIYSIRYDEWRELLRATHEEAEGMVAGQHTVVLARTHTPLAF
jgi:hypothetical protein